MAEDDKQKFNPLCFVVLVNDLIENKYDIASNHGLISPFHITWERHRDGKYHKTETVFRPEIFDCSLLREREGMFSRVSKSTNNNRPIMLHCEM